MKRGPAPGVYLWRNREYHGIRAVCRASGMSVGAVMAHLDRHGHLDRLGRRLSGGNVTSRRPVETFGRHWPTMTDLARYVGRPVTTVKVWLDNGDDDRLLAALMAADACRAAAALKQAEAARVKAEAAA